MPKRRARPTHTHARAKAPQKASDVSRLYDSLKAAAGALGLDPATLRAARAAGCSAFRAGGRVHGGELFAWLAAHPPSSATGKKAEISPRAELELEKIRQEVREKKRLNDAADELLITRAEVSAAIGRIGAKVRALLDQKLRVEYPSAVAGLDVGQARIYGSRLVDQILKEWASFSADLPE